MAFGAFLISREIFGNDLWTDVVKFRIFFYILGNAVFAEEGVKKGGIHIKRGQYLRSLRNLREDLIHFENNAEKMYSLSVLNRKINELVNEERLIVQTTKLGTLFTVVNYDIYQRFENYKGGNLERNENSVGTPLEQGWNGDGTALEQDWNTVGTEIEQQKNTIGTALEQGWNNNNNVNKVIKGIKDNQVNKVIKDKQDINDNHEINEMNEIKGEKEKTNQPTAPNISYSVDSNNEAEKKEKERSVGRSVPFQEQLDLVESSYEYAVGSPVDESISRSLRGFITLYKDHRLITAALNELSQTELPNNISVNSIPAVISKWKSKGIYSYEQLINEAVAQ